MAASASRPFAPAPWKWALWLAFAGLSGWYLLENVIFAFTAEALKADSGPIRTGGRLGHVIVAVPLLLIAPFQFSRRFRARWPQLHRVAGQVYLVGALAGSLLAAYLGLTSQYLGSRVPLVLFGLLWFAFSVAAWQCARRKDFLAHSRFVIRGYALAMAFVWVRVLGDFDKVLFPFLADEAVRDATCEWLSFVLPLLVTETWLNWWPAARRSFAAQS